ncbi:MAG: 16S rRNA processing protein RimM [Eubacterium sp.]|nr:16S rRNA processing protein RimM [Eubacterium sp.]
MLNKETEEKVAEMLRIGVVTKPHGLKGEVKVFPTTSEPERFRDCDEVYLVTKNDLMTLHVTGVKYFKKQVILKFKEFDKIEDVQNYHNCDLMIDRDDAIELAEGEYFLYDVPGCSVYDEDDNLIGEVTDVLETGANPVFVIKLKGGGDALFPVIDECILAVDIDAKKIVAHVMEGLL